MTRDVKDSSHCAPLRIRLTLTKNSHRCKHHTMASELGLYVTKNGTEPHLVVVREGDLIEIKNPNPKQDRYGVYRDVQLGKVKMSVKMKDGTYRTTYCSIKNVKPHPDAIKKNQERIE